ncbi:MAG: hypothetical protein P4L35_07170, partial [Ignavibacteriaceae bacterium]|nr:hypothetical protein [Ignavibacteriaceae bacterium]
MEFKRTTVIQVFQNINRITHDDPVVRDKKISVDDKLKAVEKAEYGEPTIELLDEIKFLLIQGDPTTEAFQKIKTEIIEKAEIGIDKVPECYKKDVEENLISQMCNNFAHEIKRNQAISSILETQLLIQLGIKIDTVLDFVPFMVQNLNHIPAMVKQVDAMAQQINYVYCVAQEMPKILESISLEKNIDLP